MLNKEINKLLDVGESGTRGGGVRVLLRWRSEQCSTNLWDEPVLRFDIWKSKCPIFSYLWTIRLQPVTFEPVAGWVLLRYRLVWRNCCRDTRWRCFAAGRQTWSSLQCSILHKFWRARETIREWRSTAPNLRGEEWPLRPRQMRSTRTRTRRKKTQLVSGLTLFCVCLWFQLKDLNEMPFCRCFKLLSSRVSTSHKEKVEMMSCPLTEMSRLPKMLYWCKVLT